MKQLVQEEIMIAPCGMNCTFCVAHMRTKNRCAGCNANNDSKPGYCVQCVIVHCTQRAETQSGFCFECPSYPCRRLKTLDARYRSSYGMSMFGNLMKIQAEGLQSFVASENERWKCATCGAMLCIHKDVCPTCKEKNPYYTKSKKGNAYDNRN